ncbi:MAG: efflux RND transporter periplasmic adaptor subunit [Pseudomonadota bacterium]
MRVLLFVTSLLILVGCDLLDQKHPHAHDNETNLASDEHHDHEDHALDGQHNQDDHAHAEEATIALTHFSGATELFVEFPALVVGRESPFLAHLTRLDDFKPLESGVVTIALIGSGVPDELFSIETPVASGIFRPLVLPEHAVKRRVILNFEGDNLSSNHDLGEFQVYASAEEALAAIPQEGEPEDAIVYLKEQQWQVEFATAEVQECELRASIAATGTLRPRADGEVYLSAASAGHIHSQGDFPYPGMPVEAGQVLATIIPRLGVDSDLSTLRASLDKARANFELAEHERERLEQLWEDKVIALHRLHEAESTLQVAKAELDAAKRRFEQSSGEKPLASTGIPILAPISGVLAQAQVAPGRYVGEGEALFHIVNVDRLWLEARIAEADIGRLRDPDGAWFSVEGFERTFNTFELDGRKVGLGGSIDPVSRTIPLIFEFDNPDQRLRSGMFANARVFTGETRSGLAVPSSAIFDDAGQEVVYVMLDGESFQRRIVRLGIRDTDRIQLLSGVQPGERVVSRGAYLLRLAATSPAEAGHGHAH